MMFRNSYRILLANFATFWKDFFYKLIVTGIVVLLTLPVFFRISELTVFKDLLTQGENLFLTFPFANVSAFFEGLHNVLLLVFSLIKTLFTTHLFTALYFSFLYLILLPFLYTLAELGVSEVLYGSMASLTKYNYSASFAKKLLPAFLFALLKSIVNLFFITLACFASYGIIQLAITKQISMLFVPFLLLIAVIAILGFKTTILSGWAPSIIVFNCGVFKGLRNGFVAVGRRFFKTYSTASMLWLINLLAMSVFGIVSAIFVLPLLSFTFTIFQMVMFFGSQGMRYYVDTDTILSPKQLEETDKIEDAKFII